MQLPFLDKKRIAGSITATVRKSEKTEEKQESIEVSDGLIAAAEDLIAAIGAKDAKGAAMALKAAFLIVDSEPHEEGEHED